MNQTESHTGDPRFFQRRGPFALCKVVKQLGLEIDLDTEHAQRNFIGVAPLHSAGPNEISFLDNRRYIDLLKETRAGAVIVAKAFADKVPEHSVALISKDPYQSWACVAQFFHPAAPSTGKIHPSAVISENAIIGNNVEISALAVIGDKVKIGDGCIIASHAVIETGVEIGANCRIGAHVTISHALLGERVVLYPGVRIGQDGFGFAVTPEGFETVPQLGRVILEDGVEIGSNTTIDRGSMKDTIIGAGSRIDNLVQIGHNVQMGRCCIVVSQAGISGSTTLEDFVTIAAQAGLIGHIHIGKKARVGAQCGVMSDVEAGSDVIGSPAMPFKEFFRNVATLRKLSRKS
ncbi:UDP-3-O-(3-hydroxymyristoyl)glucosamine N-acyltransferase [Aristophania vespae]|uniref:UDP-3-O-(3-hydroxymyristoyl)glucosamine N-acyltransferase n=1 Tax=Aristophania vespae TaxID=2697033 RepID=UPI00235187D6|nr:UDP-3-O-(3-hydroxymyristoyl)glucosamine N-acyltransferase [Aristophania vespae]UMM64605.1 UDP-3-O-acylglucosamine N-acyltransferase [Aristophania vespae]